MSWTNWSCTNETGEYALSCVNENTRSQAVFWIEQNIVYYNNSCIKNEDGEISSLFDCSSFVSVYSQANEYAKEHSSVPNYLIPGYQLIELDLNKK
jgi:hypothetical protein